MPAEFRELVTGEGVTMVCRGCLVPFEKVRTIDGAVSAECHDLTECIAVKVVPHLQREFAEC